MKLTTISIIISVVAVILAITHMIFPKIVVDTITLTLFIIAVLPWIVPLLKSVELPGGITIEFRELEKIKEKAAEAGLLAQPEKKKEKPIYETLIHEDPNLALAGLRLEIERRLVIIARECSIETERKGISQLLNQLLNNKAISLEQYQVLRDLIGGLNRAVHGAEVEQRVAEWAIDVGSQIIAALDERIGKKL